VVAKASQPLESDEGAKSSKKLDHPLAIRILELLSDLNTRWRRCCRGRHEPE